MPLPKEVCFHHFNYGNPGFQEEGIFRRVRQGVGGSNTIIPGSHVIGHAHVEKGIKPNTGQTVVMSWKGENGDLDEAWKVKLSNNATYVSTHAPFMEERMVEQSDEEFLGLYVDGVAVEEVGPKALVDKK